MSKNELIKTFCFSRETYDLLDKYAKERSISKSAVLRILIHENLGPLKKNNSFSRG